MKVSQVPTAVLKALAFVSFFVQLSTSASPLSAKPMYAPQKNWRTSAIAVEASGSSISVSPLLYGKTAWFKPGEGRSDWFAFRLPREKRFLLTFSVSSGKAPVSAVLESSRSSMNGSDGDWTVESRLKTSGRLDKFEIDSRNIEWWKVSFVFSDPKERASRTVSDIALYSLDGSSRKDYWLVVGASIQEQSIRQRTFHDMVTTLYPGYDPVVFNLAVGGWRSDHLRKALPGFLKNHPHASYVCIHIGGNNVTPNRPYPGGADKLREDLAAIIRMIKESGKVPILSRLSYRAYKGDKPVPPEENGSGPYVKEIYDPIIREHCPDFWDPETSRGMVDAYTWFKDHPEELSPDGVHVNKKGAESWNRLWAEKAGAVIYGYGE